MPLPQLPYLVPSTLTTLLSPAQGTCLSHGLQVLEPTYYQAPNLKKGLGWGPDSWELQAWAPPPHLHPFDSFPSRVGKAGQKVIHQQAGCWPNKVQGFPFALLQAMACWAEMIQPTSLSLSGGI